MKRIIKLTVDLKNKIYNTIYLKQMDTTVFIMKILDNNIVADLNEQTVDILFTKPDEKIVQQLSSDIDIESGTATIPLKEDCLRMPGKAKMELEVKNTNSEVISSFYIPIFIEKTSKDNVKSDNTPNYFEEFANAIDELKKNSTQMLEDIEEAENTRTENEKARTEAENSRSEAEEKRETAEQTRTKNEEDRTEAENSRVEAEKNRETAEQNRAENEKNREQAENTRATAEEERELKFEEIKKFMEDNKSISKKYRFDIDQDTDLGAEITLPFYYKIGADVLDVFYVGQRLIKCSTNDDEATGHYSEVGEADSVSNKIKITSDWKASAGNYFEFVVRGEYDEA